MLARSGQQIEYGALFDIRDRAAVVTDDFELVDAEPGGCLELNGLAQVLGVILEDVAHGLLVDADVGRDRQERPAEAFLMNEPDQTPRSEPLVIEIRNRVELRECANSATKTLPFNENRHRLPGPGNVAAGLLDGPVPIHPRERQCTHAGDALVPSAWTIYHSVDLSTLVVRNWSSCRKSIIGVPISTLYSAF